MPLFLINPGGGKKKMARTKKRRSAAQRRATAKMIAANRRARRGVKRRRKATRRNSAPNVVVFTNPTGGRMAKRARKRRSAPRRRKTRARGNPTRRRRSVVRRRSARRRTFRRNPGFNIVRTVRDGAIQGLAGLAGSAAVRYAGKMIPAQANPFIASAVDIALGVAVSFGAQRLKLGANVGAAVSTGAMMRAYESILKRHLPAEVTAPLLGEDRTYGLTLPNGVPGGYGTGLYPAAQARIASGADMGLYPDVQSDDFVGMSNGY